MNAYKFEIERLDNQINSVKELYFNTRQSQAIQEDMEGENVDMGGIMSNQAAPQPDLQQ